MVYSSIIGRLAKLKDASKTFNYHVPFPATVEELKETAARLGIAFTSRAKDLYLAFNGLETSNPALEILSLDKLILTDKLLHFATFDYSVKICFDSSYINDAGEWSILNSQTNYTLTLSLNSFLSNKLWHWLEKGKPIWNDNFWLS
jgi:hypothetical protein